MDNVLVGFSKALLVVYIPSQGLEERINEFSSNLGLVVMSGFVGCQVIFKSAPQSTISLGGPNTSPRDALTILTEKALGRSRDRACSLHVVIGLTGWGRPPKP